jgi:CheY-like chemotaxis protein
MAEDRRYSVLLVDDEPCIRETMAMLLNEEGYDVTTAIHGLDALDRIQLAVPDVIISDLNMPQMSGFELLSVVRSQFPSIPVMAMSGDSGPDDWLPQGLAADAFYAKGQCRPDEVLQMVAHLISAGGRLVSYGQSPDPVLVPRYGNASN